MILWWALACAPKLEPLVVNEIFPDAGGEFGSFIELYNPNDEVLPLEGWTLENDNDDDVLELPDTSGVPADSFLLVGPAITGRDLLAPFDLNEGDQLTLSGPDGTTETHSIGWQDGFSVGRFPDGAPGSLQRLLYPTPRTFNSGTCPAQPATFEVVRSTLLPLPASHDVDIAVSGDLGLLSAVEPDSGEVQLLLFDANTLEIERTVIHDAADAYHGARVAGGDGGLAVMLFQTTPDESRAMKIRDVSADGVLGEENHVGLQLPLQEFDLAYDGASWAWILFFQTTGCIGGTLFDPAFRFYDGDGPSCRRLAAGPGVRYRLHRDEPLVVRRGDVRFDRLRVQVHPQDIGLGADRLFGAILTEGVAHLSAYETDLIDTCDGALAESSVMLAEDASAVRVAPSPGGAHVVVQRADGTWDLHRIEVQ